MDCAAACTWDVARMAQASAVASSVLGRGLGVGLMSLLPQEVFGEAETRMPISQPPPLIGPRALKTSVGLRRERGRDGLFEVCGGVFVVADEVLDDAALSVNDEGVRDAVVVGEEEADGVLVGAAELVLYLVALNEVGDFGPVFLA